MPNYAGTAYARRSPSYDEASHLLFRQIITSGGQINDARRVLIDTLIRRLKNTGVWDTMDALWVMAATDSVAAGINWVNPGTYTLGAAGSPTFTADRGYASPSAGNYLTTGITYSSLSKLVQDSVHLGAWALGSGSTVTTIGRSDGTGTYSLTPNATSNLNTRLSNTTGLNASSTLVAGYHTTVRRSSTAYEMYQNAASIGSGSQASSAPAGTCFLLNSNGTYAPNTAQISIAHFGSQWSAAQVLAAYSAFNAYMQAVGAV